MKPFEKAFSTIKKLSGSTHWPEGIRPFLPDQEGSRRFWPAGFSSAGISAGIKPKRNGPVSLRDLMLIVSSEPASAASVFTTNRCAAAPVELSRNHLAHSSGRMRAIVCNSGNANAATGEKGLQHAVEMASGVARQFGLQKESVLVASTGVIGQTLPIDRISDAMPLLKSSCGSDRWREAAEAIMTTDTFPKFFAADVDLSSGPARISGIAKGSGMICPDMATMLAFLVTDVRIAPELLQCFLVEANRTSFNAITVDGDTSTNDMAAVLANGTGPVIGMKSADHDLFVAALKEVMSVLARLIVIDGEGATKFVEIRVEGAGSREEADMAAKTVANSSLVKTAIHGEDANWGRIIAAVGRSGADFNQELLSVRFDDLFILKPGFIADFSEEEVKRIMSKQAFTMTISLGCGPGSSVVWTCDLSKRYIEINGSYRS